MPNLTPLTLFIDFFSHINEQFELHLNQTEKYFESERAGTRSSPDKHYFELGLYHKRKKIPIEPGLISLTVIMPSTRYVHLQPDMLRTQLEFQHHLLTNFWGRPLFDCEMDNMFSLDDNGQVTHQISFASISSSPKNYTPLRVVKLNKGTMTTNELYIRVNENIIDYGLIDNPFTNVVHATTYTESKPLTGKWSRIHVSNNDNSTSDYGFINSDFNNGAANGIAYQITQNKIITSLFYGNYREGLRDGPGAELQLNRQTKKNVLIKGSWCRGIKEGPFIHEQQDCFFHVNYQHGNIVGVVIARQPKHNVEDWALNHLQATFTIDGKLLLCNLFNEKEPQKISKAEFLNQLINQPDSAKFIAHFLNGLENHVLIALIATLKMNRYPWAVPVCLGASIQTLESQPFPLLQFTHAVNQEKLGTLFSAVLTELTPFLKGELYFAIEGISQLLRPDITQQIIVDKLSHIFTDVPYILQPAEQKQRIKNAISIYLLSVLNKYLVGILQRIEIIFDQLNKSDTKETFQNINQLIKELKLRDNQLQQQHTQERQENERERLRKENLGALTKIDSDYLSTISTLRTEQKNSYKSIIEQFQLELRRLIKNEVAKPKSACKSIPAQAKPLPDTAPQDSNLLATPTRNALAVESKNLKASPIPVDKQREVVMEQVVTSLQAITKEENVPIKRNVHLPALKIELPISIYTMINHNSQSVIADYGRIYQRMVLKAVISQGYSLSRVEGELIHQVGPIEHRYFSGLSNAFLNANLYIIMENSARKEAEKIISEQTAASHQPSTTGLLRP